jgi:hypothetical protein
MAGKWEDKGADQSVSTEDGNESLEVLSAMADSQTNPMTETTHDWADTPWWKGTVCPTNSFRWKLLEWHNRRRAGCIGGMVLQQLIVSPGGGQRKWVDVPWVSEGESDDA